MPRFEIVKLFDLQHRGVAHMAFCKQTRTLLASFDSAPVLNQYSVSESRLVHSYPVDPGFIVDELHPSRDCRLVVVNLYGDRSWWAKRRPARKRSQTDYPCILLDILKRQMIGLSGVPPR